MRCSPKTCPQTDPSSTERSQQTIARFDRLGLPLEHCSSAPPQTMEQVAFQMLQLKRLLESAFQLDGFDQATAISETKDTVVVGYAASEGLYRSFKAHPLEFKLQLSLRPVLLPSPGDLI